MSRAPSLVPEALDRDIYLVFDNLGGCLGRAWRETQEGRTDRVTVIRDLLEGHYRSPVRIIAFNLAEGWLRDVTNDIADELALLCAQRDTVPEAIVDFVAEHMIRR
jgi:hypothetical protein